MMDTNKKELTLSRVFDAPRELVFKMWTDPDLLQQWWGPFHFTNPTCEIDARVGGEINIVMLADEGLGELSGQEFPMSGMVKEIVPSEKLVFTSNAVLKGKEVLVNLNTVTFEDTEDGKTKLTVHIEVQQATPEAEGPLAGMEMGWSQSLDKLANLIKEEHA